MKTVEKICRAKFEEWAIKALLIKEGEDYESEPAWKAWKSSWSRSRGVTIAKEHERNTKYTKPLTEEEIKELWSKCGTGKSFARMIESRHGIR